MSYLLKLFRDELAPNAKVIPGLQSQHTITYIWKGSASVNGRLLLADSAVYSEDFAAIKAGPEGALLLRWELVPEADPLHLLQGDGVDSILCKSRHIRMLEMVPTSKWLFRLDTIIGFEGATGLHAHPGSGIRCLVDGEMHVRSEKGESSDNTQPGDTWYEEGSYPVVSTGSKATFLRGMVLPPEFDKYPYTVYWIEGVQPSGRRYKCYFQKAITLR